MEPLSLARSVLAIPELLDHTIDFLSGSLEDLHSCALVSKSWVSRTQFHIFRKIFLLPTYYDDNIKLLCLLTKTLEASPHLAQCIRHLSVSLHIELLENIAKMIHTLPRLEELYVQCTYEQYSSRADLETKFLVQSLLRLPTIRGVELEGPFNSMSVIHTYFDNCTQNIQSLGLWHVHVDSAGPEETSGADPPISGLGASKIQLARIVFPLESSQILDAWISGPHYPFGFHHLQRIHIAAKRWRLFQSFLAPCTVSIEYLKLLHFSDHSSLDLNGFTKLTWLDIEVDEDWHPSDLLAVLERLPPNNCLETIRLFKYSVSAEDETTFRDFDATITALDVMHSLRRLEIDIAVLRPELDITTFRSYFPTLASKDYLFTHLSPKYISGSDTDSGETIESDPEVWMGDEDWW
ncbi:hypothetical protein MSAN_00347700 [Mycena sanguinolenta]|uniref:Uncharacterized protein n=1 Tax=Mycena sanguinolenta TaxID=230812 RepID=A0A8H6ZC98_9AGAR|nr:hypothetical protein MSAN_00347700 [Mycena sanguinolenta]